MIKHRIETCIIFTGDRTIGYVNDQSGGFTTGQPYPSPEEARTFNNALLAMEYFLNLPIRNQIRILGMIRAEYLRAVALGRSSCDNADMGVVMIDKKKH